jgi:hypothetical protein
MSLIPLQVPGYLVFGTGQPTQSGFQSALETIFSSTNASKVLWTNMRQVNDIFVDFYVCSCFILSESQFFF